MLIAELGNGLRAGSLGICVLGHLVATAHFGQPASTSFPRKMTRRQGFFFSYLEDEEIEVWNLKGTA